MTRILTADERQTLNDAMAILELHTPQRAVFMIDVSRRLTYAFGFDVTYFDSGEGLARRQHTNVTGKTFADKIQSALDIEALLPTPEEARAARAAQLREELAKLEQAA